MLTTFGVSGLTPSVAYLGVFGDAATVLHVFANSVLAVAVNTSATHWQRKSRRGGTLSLEGNLGLAGEDSPRYEPEDVKGVAPEDEAIRSEDVQMVRDAIAQLEESDNVLIVLRDIEGLSYDEIAEILEMKLGSVKSHLHRAGKRLKEKLEGVVREG